MKLSITLAAAAVILRFVTPGAGSYYVLSGEPGACTVRMEAANHEKGACHVAVRLPRDYERRLFWVFFMPDGGTLEPIRDTETGKAAVGAFRGQIDSPGQFSKQPQAVLGQEVEP